MSSAHLQNDKLWAITSYFNPMGYRRRLANYRIFRSALALPLVAVELSFGEPFELASGDADILIQRRRGDVMWQKERLLNIALASLPVACEQVVWVDCDVVFQRVDWADEVRRQLHYAPLLQPFSWAHHLPSDMRVEQFAPGCTTNQQQSTVSAVAAGHLPDTCMGRSIHRGPDSRATGFAWAARREVLQHGFYDACIVGGGDTALACAAWGIFQRVVEFHEMNDRQQIRYLAWAERFHQLVRGKVAYIEGDLVHLWHGDLRNRCPKFRHHGLVQFDFDPFRDIAVGHHGAWAWASDKPAMHQYVSDYFAARNEDGVPALTADSHL